jgi:cytochrome c oxidase assembly protein subunit 15
MGAFVSGLDAGKIYQSWPLMGNNYFPDDISIKNLKDVLAFDDRSLVQFYHRNLAYLIVLYFFFLIFHVYKNKITFLYRPIYILLFFLLLQVILGILTLMSGLNIYLASTHQITSVLLIFSALNLYYLRVK